MTRKQPTKTGAAVRRKTRASKPSARASSARDKALAALAVESERQLDELIARRLALPLEKRMNFLRRRLRGGGSCL
jgi:hypothetical protein